MSRIIKDSTHSRTIPDGGSSTTAGGLGSPVTASPSGLSGANSPMSGNRIVKTWRVMGDRTRSKTKDILKRWQTMNNGQTSEDSLAGLDDCSDMSGSTESDRGHRQKKGTWSVHVWMDSQSWIQLTPRRRTFFSEDRPGSSSRSFKASSDPTSRLRHGLNMIFHSSARTVSLSPLLSSSSSSSSSSKSSNRTRKDFSLPIFLLFLVLDLADGFKSDIAWRCLKLQLF
ncbi:uncharacterized protein [Palaemon carinicauda]|uniref:uncharacterized protein n=1 Tax=Palaemon carinicauda TaxID=392227 RepID=UPI0035B68C79